MLAGTTLGKHWFESWPVILLKPNIHIHSDLGVMDDEGFLKIIGRTKELIIVGGENVYPREIEEFLHTHPNIEDVHVIPSLQLQLHH